jgi:hypothetical protein
VREIKNKYNLTNNIVKIFLFVLIIIFSSVFLSYQAYAMGLKESVGDLDFFVKKKVRKIQNKSIFMED